jgi:hypothetical protein
MYTGNNLKLTSRVKLLPILTCPQPVIFIPLKLTLLPRRVYLVTTVLLFAITFPSKLSNRALTIRKFFPLILLLAILY